MNLKESMPDFICVGPGKTGTNTLFQCLLEHPSISLPEHVKGIRFFDKFYDRGIDWYAKFFDNCPDSSIKGEISETYFYNEKVPERIHKHLPDVKIIIVLRNPVERTFKAYLQLCKLGLMSGSFDDALKNHNNLISDNFYYTHLERFLRYFPRENMLIMLFDDLRDDQELFIKKIYNFLGVDNEFKPESLGVKFNPSGLPRFRIINQLAFRTIWILRELNLLPIIERAKKSGLVRALLFKRLNDNEHQIMSEETKEYLMDIYRDDINKLSGYLDRNLNDWLL